MSCPMASSRYNLALTSLPSSLPYCLAQSAIRPNLMICTALIEACAKGSDVHRVMAALSETLNLGERPDCAVFNAVMKVG